MPKQPFWAGLRYALDRRARAQLEREMRAQFERFQGLGLPLSHVDGHLHLHMHPFVFDRMLAMAEQFGCRRIRVPQDDWWGYRRDVGASAFGHVPLALVFALLACRARRQLAERAFVWADRIYGLFQTDRMNESTLLGLLRRLPPGSHEIYSHPDAGGRGAAGRAELDALLSPAVREVLDARAISRVTYADLEKPA